MLKKLPLIVAAGALATAVAVPASALAASNCTSHNVAYIRCAREVRVLALESGARSGHLERFGHDPPH
jgi:hypothetical protein